MSANATPSLMPRPLRLPRRKTINEKNNTPPDGPDHIGEDNAQEKDDADKYDSQGFLVERFVDVDDIANDNSQDTDDPDPMHAIDPKHSLSFALEFEFIMHWKREDRKHLVPEIPIVSARLEALCANFVDQPRSSEIVAPETFAINLMQNFFREQGFGLLGENPSGNTPQRFPDMYMLPNTGWEISKDATAVDCFTSGLDHFDMLPQYEYHGFEIKTPVLRHCAESYQHIRTVLAAINRNFRVRVNASCGMHVHVGAGTRLMKMPLGAPLADSSTSKPVYKSRTFSLAVLRRLAALQWATDPFIAALHPPERQISKWTPSIRQHSALAFGQGDNGPYKPRAEVGRPGPESDDLKEGRPYIADDAITRISPKRFPATRPRRLGKDSLARFATIGNKAYINGDESENVYDRVRPAVDILLHASSKNLIAQMMCHRGRGGNRLNYNFRDYSSGACQDSTTFDKGTIEFREASASLHPNVAAEWALLCVSMVQFCQIAKVEWYSRVIRRLWRAEEAALNGTGNQYDVISFIRDIGQPRLAETFEKRLRTMPMEHWYPCKLQFPKEIGLEYVPADDRPKKPRLDKPTKKERCRLWLSGVPKVKDPKSHEIFEWMDHQCALPSDTSSLDERISKSSSHCRKKLRGKEGNSALDAMIRKYREEVARIKQVVDLGAVPVSVPPPWKEYLKDVRPGVRYRDPESAGPRALQKELRASRPRDDGPSMRLRWRGRRGPLGEFFPSPKEAPRPVHKREESTATKQIGEGVEELKKVRSPTGGLRSPSLPSIEKSASRVAELREEVLGR